MYKQVLSSMFSKNNPILLAMNTFYYITEDLNVEGGIYSHTESRIGHEFKSCGISLLTPRLEILERKNTVHANGGKEGVYVRNADGLVELLPSERESLVLTTGENHIRWARASDLLTGDSLVLKKSAQFSVGKRYHIPPLVIFPQTEIKGAGIDPLGLVHRAQTRTQSGNGHDRVPLFHFPLSRLGHWKIHLCVAISNKTSMGEYNIYGIRKIRMGVFPVSGTTSPAVSLSANDIETFERIDEIEILPLPNAKVTQVVNWVVPIRVYSPQLATFDFCCTSGDVQVRISHVIVKRI